LLIVSSDPHNPLAVRQGNTWKNFRPVKSRWNRFTANVS